MSLRMKCVSASFKKFFLSEPEPTEGSGFLVVVPSMSSDSPAEQNSDIGRHGRAWSVDGQYSRQDGQAASISPSWRLNACMGLCGDNLPDSLDANEQCTLPRTQGGPPYRTQSSPVKYPPMMAWSRFRKAKNANIKLVRKRMITDGQ